MNLYCCDKCKAFSPPGMQQRRLWKIVVNTDDSTGPELPGHLNNSKREFELCQECREKFIEVIKRFWE